MHPCVAHRVVEIACDTWVCLDCKNAVTVREKARIDQEREAARVDLHGGDRMPHTDCNAISES